MFFFKSTKQQYNRGTNLLVISEQIGDQYCETIRFENCLLTKYNGKFSSSFVRLMVVNVVPSVQRFSIPRNQRIVTEAFNQFYAYQDVRV